MNPDPSSATPASDTAGVRVFPPAAFGLALLVGLGLQWLRPLHLAPAASSSAFIAVGVLVIVAGLVLGLSAIRAFDRADTPRNPHRPTTALAFDGPYRFTRNPMYTGMALILLGTGIATNSGWLLAIVPLFLAVLQYAVIEHEERYLERKFGAEYATYRKRVRRWL